MSTEIQPLHQRNTDKNNFLHKKLFAEDKS